MNIASIRSLVQDVDHDTLAAAEAALLDGVAPAVPIPGIDEGEQLTHVMAALWVQSHMTESGQDVMTSIRAYTQKVRASIG